MVFDELAPLRKENEADESGKPRFESKTKRMNQVSAASKPKRSGTTAQALQRGG